jgi:predicted glycosyltransferase
LRILFDIAHPAHVHFFKNPARILRDRGHELLFTSREKDIALDLLDELDIEHKPISSINKNGSLIGFVSELIKRDIALIKIANKFRPDVMAAIGGTFIAHAGIVNRAKSLIFYDTENATLQNAITYPFASCVAVPSCYQAWLPKKRHIRYQGYHELSYLHPDYFTADKILARTNGLSSKQPTFLLRLVSWQANHDIGEHGWTPELLSTLINYLKSLGKVIISAEGELPLEYESLRYQGKASEIHHLMAFCRLFIGESATMASEAAVLGVPAIYAATTGRGYTDEQEAQYGLVKNVKRLKLDSLKSAINHFLSKPPEHWRNSAHQLLQDKIDVSLFAANCIERFPQALLNYQSNSASLTS